MTNKSFKYVNPVHKQYLLPGGGVGQGESISEAAEREAREEIGYVIINQKVIGQTEEYRASEGRHYLTTAILAQVGEAVNEDLRTDEEKNVGLQVVWFSPKEVSTIFKRQVKSVHEGKINFYNTAFNIVRNKVLFEEAQKMYKIGLD